MYWDCGPAYFSLKRTDRLLKAQGYPQVFQNTEGRIQVLGQLDPGGPECCAKYKQGEVPISHTKEEYVLGSQSIWEAGRDAALCSSCRV